MKLRAILNVMLAVVVSLAACIEPLAAQVTDGWQPSKPVELWVTFGPGAQADIAARKIASIIERNGLSPVPFTVVNVPGGVGIEAFPKFMARQGDDHTLMLMLPNAFTVPLSNPEIKLNVDELTPIGSMGEEPVALWVNGDQTEINMLGDFLIQAHAKGKTFRMVGPLAGTPRAMIAEMIITMYGLDITYEGRAKVGSTAKILAEKSADATIHNPSEEAAASTGARNRPIAIISESRLSEYLDVPTLRETGMEISYNATRSLVGPPGMSEAAQRFYTDVFREVFEDSEWQSFRKTNGLVGKFLAGADLVAYLRRTAEKHARWQMAIEAMRTE